MRPFLRELTGTWASAAARRRWRPWLLMALVVMCSDIACAEGNAPFAAPAARVAPGPAGGTLRVTVAMIVVLAAVLGAAWLVRRLRGVSAVAASGLEVLAQVSLGTRERAVLIRVGAQQLLVGVAPGSVRTLHVLDTAASGSLSAEAAPMPGAPEAGLRPTFKSLLLKSLGK
jgi:flagellar protein FliO/FliZ